MHIKSIVSDEDREELERMLSLGFIIPNQLFKTRQKSRMIIYIFTPVEFLLSINCYLSESYLMFGIGIGTCVACVAWIIWWLVGSSRIRQGVCWASARARITRCCSPPERVEKLRFAISAMPTVSSAWATMA